MNTRLIVGSSSDIEVAKEVTETLKKLGLSYEVSVISAHRALDVLKETVEKDDCKVYITIAGKVARLGGITAGITTEPVIGAPVERSALTRMNTLYSIVQMPKGIPATTVAIDGGENAAILTAQMIALSDEKLAQKLRDYREEMKQAVVDSGKESEGIQWD